MKYRLKKGVEAFQVVDGEFEGSVFKPGKEYTLIPKLSAHKFEEVEGTSSKIKKEAKTIEKESKKKKREKIKNEIK